ncbi:hypothetical protein AMS68_003958 [Peltaster fructicola]|uniref:Glycosyltransferase family 25 protein n=1 Tax=Peltaster fructicola TaxID=286661 RepID=A0A6H0XUU7_9PEZI|nr:hypothetical protein AMS68_003958 [Peltaster fructicola]
MAVILLSARVKYAAALLGILVVIFLLVQFGGQHSTIPFRTTGRKTIDRLIEDTQNATLGKIYAINLPARTDHRDSLSLAAAFTGLQISYSDAVVDVLDKALPPGNGGTMKMTEKGNWRAHMNILRDMVENNISSALILEDDADWDIRIKAQMRRFAQATRRLLQPLPGTNDTFLRSTMPPLSRQLEDEHGYNAIVDDKVVVETPRDSPYGDLSRWDILWIGHCGTLFPEESRRHDVPVGRGVMLLDETVPAPQHVKERFGSLDILDQYPPHTRVVHHVRENVCTPGYAVSLPGARRILYELGVHYMDAITDLSLNKYCEGDGKEDSEFKSHVCLSVQPELIQSHRAAGSMNKFSDIDDFNDKVIEQAYTINIRWSARVNLPKLVAGSTDYIDLFKDDEGSFDLAWSGDG